MSNQYNPVEVANLDVDSYSSPINRRPCVWPQHVHLYAPPPVIACHAHPNTSLFLGLLDSPTPLDDPLSVPQPLTSREYHDHRTWPDLVQRYPVGLTVRPHGVLNSIETACIARTFPNQMATAHRIVRWINLRGCPPMAMNPALRDPMCYYYNDFMLTVYAATSDGAIAARRVNAVFRMCGIVAHNGLITPQENASRHISVTPFDYGFATIMAKFQQLSEGDTLFAPSSEHGLKFSLGPQCSSDWRRAKWHAPFPEVLDHDATVPVYDGRSKFVLPDYQQLPLKDESFLEKGMACMVLFMASFDGDAPPQKDVGVVCKTLRLHLHAVIVLADKIPQTDNDLVSELNALSISNGHM